MDETAKKEADAPEQESDEEGEGSAPAKPRLPAWWPLALVLLLTFLAYAPALQNDFTMDDRFIAMGQNGTKVHPLVKELHGPAAYFAQHYWADYQEHSELYRPVTVMSFAIRHALFGDSALVAHLINILLHLVAVWLSYLLIRGLGAPPIAATLGAAVFALHAMRSEVVASVIGRSELLGFCFGAGALLLLLRSRPWEPWSRIAAQAGASLLLFLAFCSKESSVAWVPFIVLYDLLQRRILQPGSSLFPPLMQPKRLGDAAILVAPLTCFLDPEASRRSDGRPGLRPDGRTARQPAPRAALRHAGAQRDHDLGLWAALEHPPLPALGGLRVFGLPAGADVDGWRACCSSCPPSRPSARCSTSGLRSFKDKPLLAIGPLLFLGFSFLTSNVLFPIGTIFGDRLYYAPALGLSFFAAWVAREGAAQLRQSWLAAARPALIFGFGMPGSASTCMQIEKRIPVWSTDAELFAHESLHQPSSARMLFCLAGRAAQVAASSRAARRASSGASSCIRGTCPGWNKLGRDAAGAGTLSAGHRCTAAGPGAARRAQRSGGTAPPEQPRPRPCWTR